MDVVLPAETAGSPEITLIQKVLNTFDTIQLNNMAVVASKTSTTTHLDGTNDVFQTRASLILSTDISITHGSNTFAMTGHLQFQPSSVRATMQFKAGFNIDTVIS